MYAQQQAAGWRNKRPACGWLAFLPSCFTLHMDCFLDPVVACVACCGCGLAAVQPPPMTSASARQPADLN
jgi:hypothetical protein